MNDIRLFVGTQEGPLPPGSPSGAGTPTPNEHFYGDEERSLFYYSGGAREGAPMLLIHGLGGWAEHWFPILAGVADYRCLIPDLPGFGRSQALDEPSSDALCGVLVDLMRAETSGRVILVGHSLGAGLAMKIALSMPERVHALILIDAAGFSRRIPMAFRLASLPGVGEVMSANTPTFTRLRWRAQFGRRAMCTDEFIHDVCHFLSLFDCRRTYLKLLRNGVGLMGLRETIVDRLPDLRCPVLLCWGGRDRILSVSHVAAAAPFFPDLTIEIFEDSGHYPHWEEPERFIRSIRRFLHADRRAACA